MLQEARSLVSLIGTESCWLHVSSKHIQEHTDLHIQACIHTVTCMHSCRMLAEPLLTVYMYDHSVKATLSSTDHVHCYVHVLSLCSIL